MAISFRQGKRFTQLSSLKGQANLNDDCHLKKASILSLFERKNKDASLHDVCSVIIMLPHLISKATLTAVFVWDVESVKSQVSEFAQIKSYTASQEILWKAAQYSNSADKTKQGAKEYKIKFSKKDK